MAATPSGVTARHWVYLDDQRSHEVHAQIAQRGADAILHTTEFPAGSRDPGEVVHAQTQVNGEAELVTLIRELEDRLALTGTYYRADAQTLQWSPLPAPTRTVDLRAHESALPDGGKMRFHHFHGASEGRDKLLIAMPRPGMQARHVLAEMTFQFPHVDAGELNVLHTRLSSATLASTVAREHIEAPRRGLRKLFEPADYERTYGSSWLERTRSVFAGAAARLVGGPAPVAAAPKIVPHKPPNRLEEIKAALSSQKVATLRGRWLDPMTEARLVEGGEHAIRKWIQALRRKQPHQAAYDISVLEAALLLEYAIPAQMWDLAEEEGSKMLRFMYGYA